MKRWKPVAIIAAIALLVVLVAVQRNQDATRPHLTKPPRVQALVSAKWVHLRAFPDARAEYAKNGCFVKTPKGAVITITGAPRDEAFYPLTLCSKHTPILKAPAKAARLSLFPSTGPAIMQAADLLTATAPVSPATGSDIYYVSPSGADTNAGTSASPKLHFYAFYSENASMGCAGITGSLLIPRGSVIRMKAGTYSQDVYYPLEACNLSGVTVEPDSGAAVIEDGGGTWTSDSLGRPIITTEGGQGTLMVFSSSGLDDFTYKGRGPAGASITVRHYNETASGQGSVAAVFGRDSTIYTTDVRNTDIRFVGLIVKENGGLPGSQPDYWGDDHTFYLNGGYCTSAAGTYAVSTQPANITIAHNQLLSVTSAHIQSYTGPRPCQVQAAWIYGNYFNGGQVAVLSTRSPVGPKNWRVFNNTIVDAGMNLHSPFDGSGTATGVDRRVNLGGGVSLSDEYGASGCPSVCEGSDSSNIYENNIVANLQSAAAFNHYQYKPYLIIDTTAAVFRNNLVYTRRPTNPVLFRSENPSTLVNTDYTTLASYQAATGRETNSVSGDPVFVTESYATGFDFATQSGSPARAVGIVNGLGLTSTLTMAGASVTLTSTPDIGAWQSATTTATTTAAPTTTLAPTTTTTIAPIVNDACPASRTCVFPANPTPTGTAGSLGGLTDPFTYGFKFSSSTSGSISHIRFYRPTGDTAARTVRLFTTAGIQVSSAVASVTTAGWRNVALSSPFNISASTTYVATVDTPGLYPYTYYVFSSAVTSGVLTAPATATSANGVYSATIGVYPTNTFQATSYGVDIAYDTTTVTTTTAVPAGGTCIPTTHYTVTATASSGTVSALTDNDETTPWAAVATVPQSIVIDLGSAQTITKVYVRWVGGRGAGIFTVSTSSGLSARQSNYRTNTLCYESPRLSTSARYVTISMATMEPAGKGLTPSIYEVGVT